MTISALNLSSVKSKNRSLVLYLLNKYDKLSRKEISALSSLTPAAVTKICQNLIDEGYIRECGEVAYNGKTGRREILLTLCLDDKLVFGVNAEQDAVTLSLSNMAGSLIASKRIPFCDDVSAVADESKAFLQSLDYQRDSLVCAGICVIGSPNEEDFGVWRYDDIVPCFENALGIPALVENNVKAYSESSLIYDDIDDSSVLFFKWGPGLGSSIAYNGKVFSGNDNGVAEIGHYIVNKGGKPCRCGRFGCLETEASSHSITKSVGGNMSLDKIINSSDNNIINIMDEKIDMVALALTNTATILNPRSVVLFGSMFQNQLVVDKLIRQCIRYNKNFGDDVIRLSSLNEKSDYIGATAICAKHCFFEREV